MSHNKCIPDVLIASVHPLYDNRISKHITTLIKHKVPYAYFNVSINSRDISIEKNIHHVEQQCDPKNHPFKYLGILISFISFCINNSKTRFVHIHDNVFLPATPILKLIGKKIVYDKHEFFENYSKYSKSFELFFGRFIDTYILVTDNQRPFLEEHFKNKVFKIIPNYQSIERYEKYSRNNNVFSINYIGSLSSEDRDIDSLLYIIEKLLPEKDIHIHFGGIHASPELLERLHNIASNHTNFHLYLDVPYETVIQVTKNSDIGLWLLLPGAPPTSSPNKVYENLLCGNVIIARKGFQISELINRNNAGQSFDYDQNDEIVSYIKELYKNSNLLSQIKKNSYALGRNFSWEQNEHLILEAYN